MLADYVYIIKAMTIEGIAKRAKHLGMRRDQVEMAERTLQSAVAEFLAERHGSMREMAKQMDITVQYLCDIRHGRRKVSGSVVDKLAVLK